jgi:hypothetical protein
MTIRRLAIGVFCAACFWLACTPGQKQMAKSAAEVVCATAPMWAAKALDAGHDSGDSSP